MKWFLSIVDKGGITWYINKRYIVAIERVNPEYIDMYGKVLIFITGMYKKEIYSNQEYSEIVAELYNE